MFLSKLKRKNTFEWKDLQSNVDERVNMFWQQEVLTKTSCERIVMTEPQKQTTRISEEFEFRMKYYIVSKVNTHFILQFVQQEHL